MYLQVLHPYKKKSSETVNQIAESKKHTLAM